MKSRLTFRLSASVAICLLVPALGAAREVAITILHTADLHGHLAPVMSEREAKPGGGLLRCATLIREIREREPNTLLLDCGDLFQGSAESFLARGRIMAEAVQILRYDALIVGNHEFDWGLDNLRRLYQQAGVPVLAADIRSPPATAAPIPGLQPFLLKEMDGVRVLVIGLSNPLIPRWFRPNMLGDLVLDESVVSLRRLMPRVREQRPDILVLAAHQGCRQWGDDQANQINALARFFPELDVIIGAHTHADVDRREINRVMYTQAGAYGLWLGKITLTYDVTGRRLKNKKAELLPVDSTVKPEAALERRFAEPLAAAEMYLKQTVGTAAVEHAATSRWPGQSAVQTLLARSIAEAVGADVVFHGVLSEATLRAGRISMRDVWRIVPFENRIGVARLTLEELRRILEENSKFIKSSNFRGVYGVEYDLDPKAPSDRRVSNVRLTGARRLKDDERVKVAFNSYDLASAGDRFPVLRAVIEEPQAGLDETNVDTRDAVIEYIRKHSPVNEPAVAGAHIVPERK